MSDKAAEESIEEFVAITNSSRYLAEQYLQRNDNDVVEAVEDYYANKDPSSTPSSQRGGQFRTLRDLNAPEGDDSDDDKPGMNYFTGGEKSGLQVENPNKDKKSGNDSLIDQIFQRAKEQMTQPDDRPSAASGENEPKQPKFTGRGFKLGDSNEPSQEIPDLSSSRFPRPPNKVTRQITFWKQGFTVGEDGPLYRYDDPRNTNVLQELNQGRVPISILDVEFGQDVDVSVFKKTDEEWTPPKRKVAGYFGTGHRLGSPVPGEPLSGTATPTEIPAEVPKPTEPEGEGDSLVQIRFANGKKAAHKFNSADSVIKVYEFVRNHEFNDASKPFTLSHAFPVKPIEESIDVTVAGAKLKNAVIVQRWK